MPVSLVIDEALIARLPMPLAQLYRRAHNAKSTLERHQAAFYLWEAGLKLLGSACIVAYARLSSHDPELAEELHNLARPSLGHWWGFVRRLAPVLADRNVAGFGAVRDLLLGKPRTDLPRAAGLDAALIEALEDKRASKSSVYVAELFDKLVRYRNREFGHGAAGQRSQDFYERMGRSLLLGVSELLAKLDVLLGQQLVFIAEIRQAHGNWLVPRYELIGETARRLESLEIPKSATAQLPDAERVYMADSAGDLTSLHPLFMFDLETSGCAFLNSRRGRAKTEYLCYTTGQTFTRPDMGGEQRALLAQALGLSEISETQAEAWSAKSQADEPAAEDAPIGAVRKSLGEFELLSELGRGGMGVVYRAWQPSLGRQVALKSMTKPGDAKAEARFRREIRALGQVEHPHLVKIFTDGSYEDQIFYVMELVEGTSLADVGSALQSHTASVTEIDLPRWQQTLSSICQEARNKERVLSDLAKSTQTSSRPRTGEGDKGKGPGRGHLAARGSAGYVRQIVELVRQAAEAAHVLHQHGVIHRDIKPGNILVNEAGDQATLMDLGLAQVADDEEGRLTRTRQFVGTLRYASPQQVSAVSRLDARSDVYSLGATLWELLALRPLFGATEQTSTPELMEKILHDEPARLRSVQPDLPRDLEAITHKCLEKKPEARYATAQELADDLRRWLDGEAVQARSAGWLDRQVKWVRRHPTASAAYGLTVLALMLLLIGGSFAKLLQDARAAQKRAEKAEQEVREAKEREAIAKRREAEQRVQAVLRNAHERLETAWRADDERGLAEARSGAEKAVEIARSADADAEVKDQAAAFEREVTARIAQARRNQILRDAILDVVEPREIGNYQKDEQGQMAVLPQPAVEQQFTMAFLNWGLDFERTPIEEILSRLQAQPESFIQEAIAGLDEWCLDRRRRKRPEAEWKRLKDLADKLDGNDRRREIRGIRTGNALRVERALAEVATALSPWLALSDLPFGPNTKRLQKLAEKQNSAAEPALAIVALSRALQEAGDRRRAEGVLRAGLTAQPGSVVLLDSLGRFLEKRGPADLAKAIECYTALRSVRAQTGLGLARALARADRTGEGEEVLHDLVRRSPDNPETHFYLGIALADQQKLDDARAAFLKAIDLKPDYAEAYNHLGAALADQQKFDQAIVAYRQAIKHEPDSAEAYNNLGNALAQIKNLPEAEVAYQKALDLDPAQAAANYNLGRILRDQKELDQAIVSFRKAIGLKPDFAMAYNELGSALYEQKKLDEAVAALRKSVALKPDYAEAYNNLGLALTALGIAVTDLGIALTDQNKLDEAAAAYRKAISLKPNLALAHHGLGIVFHAQKMPREAMAAYRNAIQLGPDLAEPYNNLGLILADQKKYDEAIEAYRKAIERKADFAEAYTNLGMAFFLKKSLAPAVEAWRTSTKLLPQHAGIRKNLRLAELWLELEKRWPAIIAGKEGRANAAEMLDIAGFCGGYKNFYRMAARFFADAFAIQPQLADDLANHYRYNAACSAALAAAGQGDDAAKLDDAERSQLRNQALQWLQADLSQWTRRIDNAALRPAVIQTIQHWQEDSDLASVREPAALAKLPEAERESWRKLWTAVTELLKKTGRTMN
jgi:serine/threonine protein kinase/Tfp pilus assembly protein PilF